MNAWTYYKLRLFISIYVWIVVLFHVDVAKHIFEMTLWVRKKEKKVYACNKLV